MILVIFITLILKFHITLFIPDLWLYIILVFNSFILANLCEINSLHNNLKRKIYFVIIFTYQCQVKLRKHSFKMELS